MEGGAVDGVAGGHVANLVPLAVGGSQGIFEKPTSCTLRASKEEVVNESVGIKLLL